MLNLKDLHPRAMLQVTQAWTDADGKRPLLERSPVGRALLPEVDAAHDALVRAVDVSGREDELTEIQEEQARVDLVHDRKLRGAFYALTGFAELTDDPGERAALVAARDQLSPRGLAEAQRTYREEAEEITRLDARLTDDARVLLKRIPAPGGTLWASVEARVRAAQRLAELEDRRAELAGADPATSLVHARNAWVQVMRALDAALAVDPAGPSTRQQLISDLAQAQEATTDGS